MCFQCPLGHCFVPEVTNKGKNKSENMKKLVAPGMMIMCMAISEQCREDMLTVQHGLR